ncbi:DNA topoisomerase IB [Burkholderiaceae bacterium UC74_6]
MPTGPRPSSSGGEGARLVLVSDEMPGIRRVRRGHGFGYRASDGLWLRDGDEIQRIRKLAIPPAYRDVWICPLPNGHLQATGRDARGRKQYRYHPEWRVARDTDKFAQLLDFGLALPRLRGRVARDLRSGPRLSREVLLAGLMRLLDKALLRVGNEEYARSNGSYGLTTLRNPHARVNGDELRLNFRGKSGVRQDITLQDARLARIVRRCQRLPGRDLFQYQDETGEVRGVSSADVNRYLSAAAGGAGFTAKDFRTWHASVLALELTRQACEQDERTRFNAKAAKSVLAEVAARLGNTPAVCKRSYVHPAVQALWRELCSRDADAAATARKRLKQLHPRRPGSGLRLQEQRLLLFLGSEHRGRRTGD